MHMLIDFFFPGGKYTSINFIKLSFIYGRGASIASKYNFTFVFCKGLKEVNGINMCANSPNNHSEI